MILTAHRPVEEPVKRKGSLKPYIFWRINRRGTHQGAGIKYHSEAGKIQASQLVVKIGVAKTGVTIDSVF
jgi:hypothetical protein